ncbi:MAG: EVE domain-containing protein [Candidatus Eisenbacteria bacterium]
MAAWVFKTEPSDFSFDDLAAKKSARWDGVKNAVALKHLREAQKGDVVVVYHTGDEKSAVGLAKVVRAPYPDPALDDPKRVVVDLAADRPLPAPVPLGALREEPVFADSPLVRIGRLSVVPLTAAQLARVKKLGGLG